MTPKDEMIGADVHERVNDKFFDWLLTSKLAQTEDLFDGLLTEDESDSQIAFDACSRKPTQRLLLEVEKEGEIRRAEIRRREQELKGIGRQLLSKKMRDHMVRETGNFSYVKRELLRLNSAYVDIIQEISSPIGSIKRLSGMLPADKELSDNLLRLVNNPEFCRAIKRPSKKVTDVAAACGLIGMDGLRFLVPGIFLKNRLRIECPHFPLLGQKIWSYYVTSSNAARRLMMPHSGDSRDELTMMATGSILCMGMAALHNQFDYSFEKAKRELLEELRQKKKVVLYQAVLDITPSGSIMRKLFEENAMDIVENIVYQLDWGHKGKIRQAVMDQVIDTHYDERSHHGVFVGQGTTYAMWFLLKNANLLKDNPKLEKRVMYHSRLSMDRADELKEHSVNKLVLGEYIG